VPVLRLHRLTPEELLTPYLDAGVAVALGQTVGEKLALAHQLETPALPPLDVAVAVSITDDDATRHLLETVLRREEAYVDSLDAHLELARRQRQPLSSIRDAGD